MAPDPTPSAPPPDTEAHAALLALHHASPLVVGLFDPADRLRYANPAFRQAYDLAEGEAPTWAELMRLNHRRGKGAAIRSDDIERWIATALSRRGKVPHRAFEADLCDGRWLWMQEHLDAAGWMLCVACDITQLRSEERLLRQARDVAQRAALTDPLTHVSNRLHILQLLDAAVAKARSEAAPCCLAILDLDHFKGINDRHGHPFGDAVLVDFARRVQALLRRSDCLGRLGGEEFMVLLPELTLDGAREVLERLPAHVAEPHRVAERQEVCYTLSAGLTMLLPGDSAHSAYQRADRAMYEAKRRGRNQVRVSRGG
ncbi:diguanylate cyclase [Aquincola sp. MAHUQ-54]|uniref:diguanylate cyclase n=1 Tax=Aquincola agrisoli TaxID=3119538 RepID=A0AAW9QFH0_9BURK